MVTPLPVNAVPISKVLPPGRIFIWPQITGYFRNMMKNKNATFFALRMKNNLEAIYEFIGNFYGHFFNR